MLCFCFLAYRSQAKITPALLITRSTVSVMLVAFLLPKMHERYFFPADVFTILLAFYPLRHYLTAIGMGLTSFFAYAPTLFGVTPIPIAVRAAAVLIPLLTLV